MASEDLDQQIIDAIRVLALADRAWLRSIGNLHGLSATQVQVLDIACNSPRERRRASAITRELNARMAAITEAVDILVERGMLERESDESDLRATILNPTPLGRRTNATAYITAPALTARLRRSPAAYKVPTYTLLLNALADLYNDGTIETLRSCLTCRFFRPTEDEGKVSKCWKLKEKLPPEKLRIDCKFYAAGEAE